MTRPRTPSVNGPAERPAFVATPPEAEPGLVARYLPNLLACAMMFLWAFVGAPEPQVLATVPGVLGVLWLAERCRTWLTFVGWMCVFGAVAIGFAYRWLAPTTQAFGGLSAPAAWAVTAVFGIAGTVHAWVFGFFYRGMLSRGRRPHPLSVAALVVACEALPIRFFPWSAGHGAVDVPPLVQLAEWGGVPLMSFALLALVVPLHELLRAAFPGKGPAGRPAAAFVSLAVGAALFCVGLVRYGQIRDEEAGAEDRMKIAIVQANVGSKQKRDATEGEGGAKRRSIQAYRAGSERAVAAGAELIVWPETAITAAIPLDDALQTNAYLGRADVAFGFLNELGKDRGFLVGLYEMITARPSVVTGERRDVRYNAAGLRQPGGREATWSRYRKVFLIPFGEAMPFGLFEERLPQSFRMKAGTMPQAPLEFRGRRFVPFLCYEGILPDHVRELTDGKRPDVLVSLTNDSWFTGWEPAQHLNFTRLRAVEHRAPLVRATNTGISAFVSASGDVESRLAWDTEGVLVADVPFVNREPTLYVRGGWRLPWLLGAWALLAWFLALLRPGPGIIPPAADGSAR